MDEFPHIEWGSTSANLLTEWLTSPEAHQVATDVLLWHVGSPIFARNAARNVLSALHAHILNGPEEEAS